VRRLSQAQPGEAAEVDGRTRAGQAEALVQARFLPPGVFPTDIVTSITVGHQARARGRPWWHALGFVALSVLFVAIPAILVVVLGSRAQMFLPKVRDWMNTNSWIVSEIVIALFMVGHASAALRFAGVAEALD
jgi:hypothetical protein